MSYNGFEIPPEEHCLLQSTATVCECVALTGAKCRGWDRGSWVIGVAAEAEMAAPVVPFCWEAECCCTAAARACWRNSCCCMGAMVNWGRGERGEFK